METNEKLRLIEECMDLEESTIKPEDNLENYDEWDSVTALSIIAMIDAKFHKTVSGDDLKKAKTVADVLAMME